MCILYLLLLSLPFSLAILVNITIDDTIPDRLTGAVVSYNPTDAWNLGTECNACTARPDKARMFASTWHDSTFNLDGGSNHHPNRVLSAHTTFNGTAVYVFCALARTTTSPTGDSDMTFVIDGQVVGTFQKRAPGIPGFDYNVTVYANTTLSPAVHTLEIQNGHVDGYKSLLILDAIVYTYDDGNQVEPDARKPIVPAIVGSVIAGVAIIAAVCIGLYLLFRRRKKRHQMEGTSGYYPPILSEPSFYPFETGSALPTNRTESAGASYQLMTTSYPSSDLAAREMYPRAGASSVSRQEEPSSWVELSSYNKGHRTEGPDVPPAYDSI
ncbi:hypothetical protein AMATHDRAFT_281 [Amanita thiersii Skay4041]|uniref:Uncharacterized protein n=1 Tax=Amanita thiersii Skay4041 TaxID=703135 RepID=A0A2A9NVZ2_9AGAR|nr:hypothetical protein AMATHDRAFT_281 [Amanita thiersii Skay4041]